MGVLRSILCFALAISLVGCVLPPTSREATPTAKEQARAAITVGIDERTLARAAATPQQMEFVRRVNAIEAALSQRPLLPGNEVTLLIDGPATHKAQLAAIARARHHIHLVVYIISDDTVGQRYLEALRNRARAGVKIRVMFDAVGGVEAGSRFREKLEKAGIELHEYGPLLPELWAISRRDHRKILVVDGRVAFTGGINISDTYTASSSSIGVPEGERGWRDTNVRIVGPAVAEFQRIFINAWEQEEAQIPPAPQYFPDTQPDGSELVRAIVNRGNDLTQVFLRPFTDVIRDSFGKDRGKFRHAIYASYLAAIRESRERVWITQAYFAPNKAFSDVLKQATKRGVDVRLLVPARSDVGLMLHASRGLYRGLLKSGIRIYEYEGAVLHAKTAVVDGVWATVGSSNLDYRSFIHNEEANAIIVGHRFGTQMEHMFLDDLSHAREIKLAEWRKRPLLDKLKEGFALLTQYWI